MSINSPTTDKTAEPDDDQEADTCEECSSLDDGFPCADCFISGDRGLPAIRPVQ